MMKIFAATDGSYRRQDGVMIGQFGWSAIVLVEGVICFQAQHSSKPSSGIKSPFDAEWMAFLNCLNWAKTIKGETELHFRLDCQQVIDRIKRKHPSVKATWVPRERNSHADRLSRFLQRGHLA